MNPSSLIKLFLAFALVSDLHAEAEATTPAADKKDLKKVIVDQGINYVETAQKGITLSGYVNTSYTEQFVGVALPPVTVLPLPVPHPHLFLVYTGTAKVNTFSTAHGLVPGTRTLFLVTDLANPANYSLLVVDPAGTPAYHIYTRILSPDGVYVATYDDGVAGEADPSDDLLANAIYTPGALPPITPYASAKTTTTSSTASGLEAFKFSLFGSDTLANYLNPIFQTTPSSNIIIFPLTHNYPRTSEIYATGPLTGLSTEAVQVVIPANLSSSSLPLADDSATKLPPYQVNAIPAPYYNYIGTKLDDAVITPYATGLSGSASFYDYDATLVPGSLGNFSPLARATDAGSVSLSLNTTLSGLANVGGSYEVPSTGPIILPLSIEIPPIAIPLSFSHRSTAYETFLYHLVLSLGLKTTGYVPGQ